MRRIVPLALLVVAALGCGNDLAGRIARRATTGDAATVIDSVVPRGTPIDTAIARLTARGFACARAEWRIPATRCAARAHVVFVRDESVFLFLHDSAGRVPRVEVATDPHHKPPADSLDVCRREYQTNGSGGGTGPLSENVMMTYTYQASDGRAKLTLAAVVHGYPGWLRNGGRPTFTMPPRPTIPEKTGSLAGITIHDVWFQYDPGARVAWVNTTKVELADKEVVLVELGDSASVPLKIVATVRLPDPTLLSSCPLEVDLGVRAVLERSPEVRAFIHR
jgi:hypothetical protein